MPPAAIKQLHVSTTHTCAGNAQAAHVHLEQMMQPGFPPPPPFKRFMRKAMVNKASQMLVQLQVGARFSSCFQYTL